MRVVITRPLGALLVFCVVALGGCSDGSEPRATGSPSPKPTARPAISAVGVEINHPTPGMQVTGPTVFVSLTLRSFTVVDEIGRPPRKGEGHVVFYLDADRIPTTAGRSAVTADGKRVVGTSHRWEDVEPGKHTLAVQLVNNDDTPLSPPVTDEVTVTVTAP